MAKYYIIGGSEYKWSESSAKTLTGAKIEASKSYQMAVDRCILVGDGYTEPDGTVRIFVVAIKHGYEKWRTQHDYEKWRTQNV